MYGRQSEIQRIQSKLQRIGTTNPYRHAPENTSSKMSSEGLDKKKLQNHSDLERTKALSTRFDETAQALTGKDSRSRCDIKQMQSFVSTRDRYRTHAGQQALKEMGKVAERLEPLIDEATFLPHLPTPRSASTSSAWPNPAGRTESEASKNSHHLAHTLRQQSYTATAHRHAAYSSEAQSDWHDNSGYADYPHGQQTQSPRPGGWRPNPRFSVTQGLIWVLIAAIVRIAIDRLLVAFPSLWLVMVAMVLTPVAVALYQTAVNPPSTVHSGRRLLVVMMGLLIGGQF